MSGPSPVNCVCVVSCRRLAQALKTAGAAACRLEKGVRRVTVTLPKALIGPWPADAALPAARRLALDALPKFGGSPDERFDAHVTAMFTFEEASRRMMGDLRPRAAAGPAERVLFDLRESLQIMFKRAFEARPRAVLPPLHAVQPIRHAAAAQPCLTALLPDRRPPHPPRLSTASGRRDAFCYMRCQNGGRPHRAARAYAPAPRAQSCTADAADIVGAQGRSEASGDGACRRARAPSCTP